MTDGKASGSGTKVYVGPGFRGMAYGTIYRGGLPGHLEREIAALPALGDLLVDIRDLAAAQAELRKPGSRLRKLYKHVAEAKKGG